ncbi:MAG: glycosyltransferase family 4 protein [Planctomycetota bacterium]
MRLLYLCSDFGIDPQGAKGASVHLRSITRALADLGHEVLLLSPKGAAPIGHPAKCVLADGCASVEGTTRQLKRWLTQHAFDDEPAKELRPLLYNAFAVEPALKALSANPPEAIIERLSLFGHVGMDLAEALGVPRVLEVNAPLAEEASRFRSLQLRDLAWAIERRSLMRADAVAVVSSALADSLAQDGVKRDKFHVIPNGADVEMFDVAGSREQTRAELGLGDRFIVGFVGSLKAWHGVDVLLEAFAGLLRREPSAMLLVVGVGPEAEELRRQADELGIGGATLFTGVVMHELVPKFLRAMDVAVAPFRNVANFYFSPIKLFEYLASGTCVVASRLGQIAEIVEDGVTGTLVNPEDPAALCDALLRLSADRAARERMATAGAALVRGRYTWDHAASALSAVIDGVVGQRTAGGCESLASSGSTGKGA